MKAQVTNMAYLGIKYLHIKIDDTEFYKISKYFEEVYNFIDNTLGVGKIDPSEWEIKHKEDLLRLGLKEKVSFKEANTNSPTLHKKNKLIQLLFKKLFDDNNGNRILIHCSMGVSRSPTMAIMYLMKKLEMGFEEVSC
jgi:protein tyrosine phosphatase